ncbi:MAG TPA: RNA methyltransferase, partial [Thermoplasmata archaeon]|nr:RNA methyltransferase [Thermoplasmata archaeon]
AVVTDLPYGRSSRVAGRNKREIASILVSSSAKLLGPGARLVATTDSPGELERSAAEKFEIEERFSLFVHRSLTRHIFVMAKR